MNKSLNDLYSVVQQALYGQTKKTEKELRNLIRGLAAACAPGTNDDDIERIAREIEAKQGVRAGLGALVASEDFAPWLDDAKSRIEPFYWERYKKFILRDGLPWDVVIAMDQVTDRILGRLGNPESPAHWDRRGMVVGHVQSGKTANYIGLICKAADAGYRLIIVIAGIHNNLRNQTQARIDAGFIGRDTGRNKQIIGVGHFESGRTPVSLTNTLRDFNKLTASTNTSEIDSYKVPVVLVIKKNAKTLSNLLDWLRDNSARSDSEMINQPLLLIDDEADNASINTKYSKDLVTTINGRIRELLIKFQRSCYVGYTATPFANIFIDPDQDDDMYKEDLFPSDFIIGLDAPTNYFSPERVFVDGLNDDDEPTWLRYITDNEDILPIRHKIDHNIDALPPSLITALRTFLIARTIRNLRGQTASHCSMLVNASRFTGVQGRLRNCLHEVLEQIRNAVRVHASRGHAALNDPEIRALHSVWTQEYPETEFDWPDIQSNLLDAVAAAKVVEVNNRANDLDYRNSGERGQSVIAVGGYSLSRGLTLEGLTVTWFLRNTMMYDTLMQMGRWFGFHSDYEDLCRIWMPAEAIEWYAFIANAAGELRDELRTMETAKATPKMFGLAVRSHPAALLVTARNKMGTGQKITTLVGLSNRFVETARVSINPPDLNANIENARRLVEQLRRDNLPHEESPWGRLIRNVPVDTIDTFLAGWRNAEQSVTTDPGPVRNYIRARSCDELKLWDVLIPSLRSGQPDSTLGIPITPASRYVDPRDIKQGFISFSGRRMRVASRGIEKAGVNNDKAMEVEKVYREENAILDGRHANYPDRIYRSVRERGLFILHLVRATSDKKNRQEDIALIPSDPVIAWGISLPISAHPTERVEYVVNTVRYQELFGTEDDDDDQNEALNAS